MSNPAQPSPSQPTSPEQPVRTEAGIRTAPSPQRSEKSAANNPEARLEGLLNRINNIATGNVEDCEPECAVANTFESIVNTFMPKEPETFDDAGLTETQIEELIMKFLLARGDAQGRQVAEQIKIPFALVDPLLRRLKQEQMVIYRDQKIQ